MPTTVIKNAAWVVAWDAAAGRHTYRRDVDVAFADDRIVHIGRGYAGAGGPDDRRQRSLMVMPGLIDIHSHPEHEPLYRGIREEHGLPSMHMSGLYERSQALSAPDDEARAACAEVAYCELLRSGVTSLVDISPPWNGWIELFARSGLRGFLAPGYASARWYMENDRELQYAWDEARGRAGFEAALRGHRRGARRIRAAGSRASSRRCRSTPAPPICCATATPRRASAGCRSPCTSRRASSRCAR